MSPAAADAATTAVPVTGYDVMQTPAAGFGCWHHTYTGTITPTGRTLSSSACGSVEIVNEVGGGGTLNDGVTTTTIDAAQLFDTLNDDAGLPIQPTITLHLSRATKVSQILLRGGDIGGNIFPGALTGATVAVGGTSVALPAQPTGMQGALQPDDDLLDLTGTSLVNVATNTVQLSDFLNPFGQFSLAEIVVFGGVTPTSKDQCTRGGWKDFAEFKNQGDCVSFVATGGKNPPSGS